MIETFHSFTTINLLLILAGAFIIGLAKAGLKGIDMLLEAAAPLLRNGGATLDIIGDGPERQRLEAMNPGNVVFAGAASREEVFYQMARAQVMIIPSLWYEGFPVTVVEALASGLPVLGSRIGGLAVGARRAPSAFTRPRISAPSAMAARW